MHRSCSISLVLQPPQSNSPLLSLSTPPTCSTKEMSTTIHQNLIRPPDSSPCQHPMLCKSRPCLRDNNSVLLPCPGCRCTCKGILGICCTRSTCISSTKGL